jgi:hypothetical protein
MRAGNGYGFGMLKPSASAVGEADHSGAKGLLMVFSGFCEQRHMHK